MPAIIINSYAGAGQYNRTPLKMLKAIPAGFPLPIHDDYFGVAGHSDAIFSNIQSAGEDLRVFTSENMTPDTEIPIEVTEVTTGSNLIKGFVRVPSALAIDDRIYLRTTVGGGEAAYPVSDTNGRNNVWQDYETVHHGNDLTVDVTGSHSDGTNNGGVSKSGADLLNGWPAYGFGAREGTASTDRHDFTDFSDVDVSTESIIVFKDGTEDNTGGKIVQFFNRNSHIQKATTNNINVTRAATSTDKDITSTGGEFTGNAWHQITHVDGGIGNASTIYVDATALVSPTVTSNGSGSYRTSNVNASWFSNTSPTTKPGDTRIAEYRYRPGNTPTAAWASLEWDGFNDPGSIAEAESLTIV